MSQFTTPRVFQANPSSLKKRIFLIAGLTGATTFTLALLGKGPIEWRPYFFAGGITAMVFAIRFWSMQVWGGPTSLTFSAEGVAIGNQHSTASVPWAELAAINYMVSRSGHRWLFTTRDGKSHDFYLDGLTGQQRRDLEETVKSIENPNIKVVPFYDPLGLADAA